MGSREEEYLKVIERYDKKEIDQFAQAMGALFMEMEENPFKDCLGTFYETIASKSTRDARGEFYTPESLSDMIATMCVDVDSIIERGVPYRVHEPCCGAGGMILSMAKMFAPRGEREPSYVDLLRVSAVDVSQIAADMTTVNTTMWGIPAVVEWCNVLTLESYGVYPNIHYFRVGAHEEDRWRKAFRMLDEIMQSPEPEPDFTMPEHPEFMQVDLFDIPESRKVEDEKVSKMEQSREGSELKEFQPDLFDS